MDLIKSWIKENLITVIIVIIIVMLGIFIYETGTNKIKSIFGMDTVDSLKLKVEEEKAIKDKAIQTNEELLKQIELLKQNESLTKESIYKKKDSDISIKNNINETISKKNEDIKNLKDDKEISKIQIDTLWDMYEKKGLVK